MVSSWKLQFVHVYKLWQTWRLEVADRRVLAPIFTFVSDTNFKTLQIHTHKKRGKHNYRVSVLNSNVSYRICWGTPQLTSTGEDTIMFLLKGSVLCGRKLEFRGYLVTFTTFFQLSHVLPCILSLLLAVSTCTWMCDAGRNFTTEAPTYQGKHLHNNLHKATNTSGNQFVQAAKAQRPNQPLLPSLLKEGRAEEGWQRSSCGSAGSCSQAGNSHQLPEPHFILSLP